MGSPEVTIACYEKELPAFVGPELIRLYRNFYSSLPFMQTFRKLDDACVYAASSAGQSIAVLVFRKEGRMITVLNELMSMSGEEVRRFVEYIFQRYPMTQVISFPAIRTTISGLAYPFQQHNEKEDYVITLPSTPEEYGAALGKHTRHNLRRYTNRLVETHPTFNYQFHENGNINEEQFRAIVALNRERIAQKKKRFSLDAGALDGMLRIAKKHGMMNVMQIGSRLCAGSICFRIGSEYFGVVNSFDPQYDSFFLGMTCYYQTICESIRRGGTRFHMAWDRYDYKTRLQGVREDFDRLVIYRSRLHQARNAGTVAATALAGRKRQLKLWLNDPARQNSVLTRIVTNGLHTLRTWKGN